MKQLITLVLTLMVLTACAPVPQASSPTEPAYPEPGPIDVVVPEPYPLPNSYPEPETGLDPTADPLGDTLLLNLRQELADMLGLKVEEVTLVKQEEMMWSDGCLGLAQPGEMCTQAIVPGYLVVLATPEGNYEYHTDQSLRIYRLAGVSGQVEGSGNSEDVLVVWQRTGGFAGICEELTVYKDGRFILEDCHSSSSLAKGFLLPEDWSSLQIKAETIASHEWKFVPPPGSADMFLDSYSWFGSGSKTLDIDAQEEFNNYLADLVTRLKTQSPGSNDIK